MLSKQEIARLRGLSRQRRERRAAGRFLVEGEKLVAEVLASGLTVHQVIHSSVWKAPAGIEASVAEVADHVIERISSTSTPQPVVAEVEIPEGEWRGLDRAAPVLAALDLNDPGNVGTMARSAEAAGFGALIVLGATADPWGPKTVRASAGALFRLAVIEEADAAAGLAHLSELGFRRIGTRMHNAPPCDSIDLTGAIAIVLGSEAHGLEPTHHAGIDSWASIPMAGDLESLNVAMAGTILTYETARQRRHA
ncbi:MAG: RNA methyltransferase [Actinomycetota bacterium]